MNSADPVWPDLTYAAWSETLATLHLWTQIVGKIRLTLTPGSTIAGRCRFM